MANIKSSKKDAKRSQIKRKYNSSKKSTIRTFIKKVNQAIFLKDALKAELEFKKVQPILDRCATKRLIHKNKAARHKSNLWNKIKLLKIVSN